MHKFWHIFTHEMLSIVWRPSYWIGVVGIPLLSLIAYGGFNLLKPVETSSTDGIPFASLTSIDSLPSLQSMQSLDALKELVAPPEDTHLPLGFVDLAGVTRLVPSHVDVGGYVRFATLAEAQQALQGSRVRAYYVFPNDFIRTGRVLYYAEVISFNRALMLDEGLDEWVRYNLAEANSLAIDASHYPFIYVEETNLDPANAPRFDVTDQKSLASFMLIIYFLTFLQMLSSSMIFSSFQKESNNRVMEVLLVSTSSEMVLWGKFAALSLVGLLQIILWVGGMAALGEQLRSSFYVEALQVISPELIGWMVLFSVLSFLLYGTLMLGLAMRFPYLREGSQILFAVMSPLLLPVILMFSFAQAPNHWLMVLFSLIPFTAPMMILLRMIVVDVPLWQPLLSIVLLLFTTIGMVRFMARNFRPAHLLSTQKFNWFKPKIG